MEIPALPRGAMKVCLVSSCGGHLAELRALRSVYEPYPHVFVINEAIDLPPDMRGKTYVIRHAERDALVLVNLWEAWRILRRERPTLIISTGAGPAVPFALVANILHIPFLFIEISAQVLRPSLTGRLVYRLSDTFFYQWKHLGRYFPKATYGGLIR